MADPLRIAKTRIIRTPVTGPEPCNTLVFLRCMVPGLDVNASASRDTVVFQTEFRIDGYLQSQYQWYLDNTQVSATASLRFLNTTTDLTFCMAVDSVVPELQQLDGSLAFHVGLAAWFDDDAWFGGEEDIVLTATLSAYVLCFEPRPQLPPTGLQRTPWALAARDDFKLSDVLRKRAKIGDVRKLAAGRDPCA